MSNFFQRLADNYYPEDAAAQEHLKLLRAQTNAYMGQQNNRSLLGLGPDTDGYNILAQPQAPLPPQKLSQFQPFSEQDGAGPMQGPSQSAGMSPSGLLGMGRERSGILSRAFPDAAAAQAQAQAFPVALTPDKRYQSVDGRLIDLQPVGGGNPSILFDQAPPKPSLPQGADPTGKPLPGMKDYWKTEADAKRDPLKDALTKSEIEKNNRQAALGDGNMLTGDTLDMAADQLLAGDPSPMQGLGYGNVGAANRAALRNRVAEKAKESGMSGADLAAVNAEYFGTKAGERTLGTRSANIDMAVNEANNMAPLVRQASAAVPRGSWMPVNKVILAAKAGTGDPSTRAFGAAVNSFLNAYATAVGKGTMTVEGRRHAEDMMSTADGPEALSAIMDQLDQEMKAALSAPGQSRAGLRSAITGKSETAPPAKTDYKSKYGLQ